MGRQLRISVWMAFMATCLGVPVGWTDMPQSGTAPFGFGAWFVDLPKGGAVGSVTVMLDGSYSPGATAEATLAFPPGVEVINGDTLRIGDMQMMQPWTIQVRPRGDGDFIIRGILTVRTRRYVDKGEFALSLRVSGGTCVAGISRSVRKERVENGQRYRFGGSFMVPIDSAEYVVQRDIDIVSGRARVIQEVEARDTLGVVGEARRVRFVAFVDPDGKVRDARLHDGRFRKDERVSALGREALKKWRFAPARAKGRAVADWAIVEVAIVPGR